MKYRFCAAFFSMCCSLFLVCSLVNTALADMYRTDSKGMSVFISAFTRIGMYPVEPEEIFSDEDHHSELIRFGICHNYLEHTDTRIKKVSPADEHGDLMISADYVKESIEKYFDKNIDDFDKHATISDDDFSCYYDGSHFHFFTPDQKKAMLAKVTASRKIGSRIIMKGYLYNSSNEKEEQAQFVAVTKRHIFKGIPRFALISLKILNRDKS